MIFQSSPTTEITAYTTTPKRTTLKVCRGLVYKIEIEFPPGPSGLLKVQLYDGGFQVWPSSPGQYFQTDGNIISFDDTYLKLAAPFTFDIYTWNLDDTWSHQVFIRIGMVDKEEYIARFLPTYGYKDLVTFLKTVQKEQEEARKGIIEQPFSWLKESK